MTVFYLIAALMIAAALAFIALPLLRRGNGSTAQQQRLRALDQARANAVISDEEYASKRASLNLLPAGPAKASRTGFAALLLSVLILPGGAILAYSKLGSPEGIHPTVAAHGANATANGIDMDQALIGLAAKLEKTPDDGQGWALLGRAYMSTQRPADALPAFKRANELLPNDADLMAEYAQAMVMGGNQSFAGEPKALIDRALTVQPDNQRALWLRGVAEYQAEAYADAVATWTRLQTLLPPGASVAASVQAQIDDARAKAGMPAAAASNVAASAATAPATTATAATDASAPKLSISIKLDPKLQADVPKDATLFVFARAASGPPMPLAIQRLTAGQLPTTLTLDDSNGMMPNLKLSMFPQVVIGARISRSGDPIAKSGDWQTLSDAVDVQHRETIQLTIDQVVP